MQWIWDPITKRNVEVGGKADRSKIGPARAGRSFEPRNGGFTVTEVAKYLQVSKAAIRRYCAAVGVDYGSGREGCRALTPGETEAVMEHYFKLRGGVARKRREQLASGAPKKYQGRREKPAAAEPTG